MSDLFYIIQGPRQSGKTTKMMEEVFAQHTGDRRGEVLVVFPDKMQAEFWIKTWRARYPSTPVPAYTTISDRLKVRGRIFSAVYFENIDHLTDGWWDQRIGELCIGLQQIGNNLPIFTFTSSPIPLNQRTHVATVTKQNVMENTRKRWLRRKRKEETDAQEV